MNGIINIYKPKGMTSHDVVYRVRKITGIKKVGHTGTLDPDADGVLPICIGKGTKLSDMLTFSDKSYRAVFRLGVTTDTQDMSGEILKQADVYVSENEIKDTINYFIGEYDQLPPMYSAVKVGGKKLYELARKGIEAERSTRRVTIYKIDILNIENNDITIDVDCSKGTYIRTLCNDIGEKMGVGGAVVSLTRTKSGIFEIKDSITLEALESNGADKFIIPCEDMFDYDKVSVSGGRLKRVLNGNSIHFDGEEGKTYRVFDDEGKFLCVSKVKDGELVMVKSFF